MNQLNRKSYHAPERPIKILQFGEGNFLRGFADWIIQELNDSGTLNSDVAVVQPRPSGRVRELQKQDGLYTICLEGLEHGETVSKCRIIDVLRDFIDPYTDYEKLISYAESEDLEIVISNTTEAGIALDETDIDFSTCPKSFPAKLLALLKRRYDYFDGDTKKGLAIIPCELIDQNGETLRRCLNDLAGIMHLDLGFIDWLNTANRFADTLVDRIVPGFPSKSADEICRKIGFIDKNIVHGEIFHLWVIKSDPFIRKKFPADSAGLNVIFVEDVAPYRERKAKILNGAHTAMTPIAYLCGLDTVVESVNDEDVGKFINELINYEIKPTIKLPENEIDDFANSVIERFKNSFIRHELMSIALNSTSKFKTRLLPTYDDYKSIFGEPPRHILFAFASLTVFYRGRRGGDNIPLSDLPECLGFWHDVWQESDCEKIAEKALSSAEIGGKDLANDDNIRLVASYIRAILEHGERAALRQFLGGQL